MTLFSLLESFFFLCLGISFVLILLMVYHFKKRIDALERSTETLGDICKTVVGELQTLKSSRSYDVPKDQPYVFNPTMMPSDYINSVSEDLLKQIMVSSEDIDQFPSQINIEEFENEELDDVESCSTDDVSDVEDKCINQNEETSIEEIDVVDNIKETEISAESDLVPEEKDIIQVTKLDETQPIDDTMSEMSEQDMEKRNRKSLQKMNVQMLRTMVIRDGLCTDPSKLKKLELIQMILGES